MIVVNNRFGQNPMDFNEETDADRIGGRIREIRLARGMSQADLGEKVGLNADRIQKYENGVRKPKMELLKQIAMALEVETLALTDPVVSNYLGSMYAFFEMEKYYDLNVSRVDGRVILTFGDGISGSMNDYLREWERECRQIEIEMEDASSDKERESIKNNYNMWKWTFPKALHDKTKKELKELRKAKLQEKIDILQQELSDLDDN